MAIKNSSISPKKIILILLIILSLITILYSLIPNTSAYYTNIKKFYLDSGKNDGFTGLALERELNDFNSVEGCGLGTIIDTTTGLCWQKNLSSYKDYDGTTLTWDEANTYCGNLVLGGHSDWRLPTRQELMTLIDEIGGSGSTCSTLHSFNFTNCNSASHWTATTYQPNTAGAWLVNFYYGVDSLVGKTGSSYVVCVR